MLQHHFLLSSRKPVQVNGLCQSQSLSHSKRNNKVEHTATTKPSRLIVKGVLDAAEDNESSCRAKTCKDGALVCGWLVGRADGGERDGAGDGGSVGNIVGRGVGGLEGSDEGCMDNVGRCEGLFVGTTDGRRLGA